MAISFVAAGTTTAGINPTVAVPSGYASGDLLVIVITGTSVTTPSGWTLLTNNAVTPVCYIFYKTASASESSVAMTSTTTATKAVMLAYRGVGGVDVTGTFVQATTGTTIATNSLTTTQANDYVISIYAASPTISSWTAPASTSSRVNSGASGILRGLLIVDELQASAGATTSRTATLSVTGIAKTSIAFSIKEPSGANKSSFFLLF